MDFNLIYLVLAIFIFVMNIIPAFMPPTWVVLAYFYTQFNLMLIPTVVIGATSATFGRIVLATLADNYLRPYLPKTLTQNYQALGLFFKKKQTLTAPVVIAYAFLPIPSNNIFIIAGLAKIPIKLIACSFFIGRLISYTFWISLSGQVFFHLDSIFSGHFANLSSIYIEILSLGLILIVGQINWRRLLKFFA